MKLKQFKALLEANPEKQFLMQLPDETEIPVSFHITEVGQVTRVGDHECCHHGGAAERTHAGEKEREPHQLPQHAAVALAAHHHRGHNAVWDGPTWAGCGPAI